MKTTKKLKIIIYLLIGTIGLIYLSIAILLFWIGPLETKTVKKNLTKYPLNIVISLTTAQQRINKIKPTIESILRQSIQPNKIYLNIPNQLNNKYILPNWLTKEPSVIINRTKDYGPATKLIPTLEQERDPNTIIITLDNQIFYPKHIVRDLIKQYLPDTHKINYKKNSAITGIGLIILFGPTFEPIQTKMIAGDRPSISVVNLGGVAYKRSFFNDDIFSLPDNMPTTCILSDDLIISAYLFTNNISIVKISGISYNEVMQNLLLKYNLPDEYYYNYANCLASLSKHDKIKYQEIILQRTKNIYAIYKNEIYKINMNAFWYELLTAAIKYIPFLEKLIMIVMQ